MTATLPKESIPISVNKMALIALGIVFGDIGTSPLYAFSVTLGATGHKIPTELDALGIASLIIWSLTLVVFIKYITIVLRADNEGQGGILALIGLVKPESWAAGAGLGALGVLGIIGAAFLYGDGVITPAISVLSAMEGMKVLTPSFAGFIIPATLVVLGGLFALQRRGTDSIGKVFGPVMVLWFAAIGLTGMFRIVQHPSVLQAFNPVYAYQLLSTNPGAAAAIFGAVFLALTGGEALYADMGHVGAPAIRRAFTWVVLPCLILNYLGQAALVIMDPSTADNSFYKAEPAWALIPMIILAALATIIASQALISGVFSLTRQAIQMSLLPRMKVIQTSLEEIGQIYIPALNWFLMLGTMAIVLSFRTSDSLAAAYGIAVSGTMLITTILLYRVMIDRWHWRPFVALAVVASFGIIDFGFFASNSLKIVEGGWLPLSIGAAITFMMTAWRRGTWSVRRRLNEMSTSLSEFIDHIDDGNVVRIPGTAVWMTKVSDGVTPMLKHHTTCTGALHDKVVLLTVETSHRPFVRGKERLLYTDLGHGFSRLILKTGFMQTARIDGALGVALGLQNAHDLHYFVGHETVLRKKEGSQLNYVSWLAFSIMKRAAAKMSDFFHLRYAKVLEVGLRIEI